MLHSAIPTDLSLRTAAGLILCACSALLTGCASAGAAGPDLERQRAARLLELGDHAGALTGFDRALSGAERAVHHAGRGRALVALGRLQEAAQAFERAIELEPRDARWHNGLGVALLEAGSSPEAALAFDEALRIEPEFVQALYNRAGIEAAAGRVDSALADYGRVIALRPELAQAFNGRGLLRARIGRSAAAIEDFHRAAELQPLVEAHTNCAAVHYAIGDVRHAMTELNVALRLEGSNPHPLLQRGRIYLDLEQSELAARDFESALVLRPGSAEASGLLRVALTRVEADGGAAREAGFDPRAAGADPDGPGAER